MQQAENPVNSDAMPAAISAAAVQKANHSMMLQFSAGQDSPSKNPDSRRYDAEVESSE
jgi:hypothetical protein